MWLSPLTVTPAKAREAASVYEKIYFAGNAHVFMDKAAGAPSLAYSLAGRLVGTKSGWVVLEVPMALVRGAFDALQEPGAELPPPFSGYEDYKAHISVMRPEELKVAGGVDKITERGHYFRYTLGPVQTVDPAGWDEMSKVWFIKVRSPELEKLRKSYGLSARPKNNEHDFHITIAVRRKNILKENGVAKAAENSGVTPISLTPDATDEEHDDQFPEEQQFPEQENDHLPETEADMDAAAEQGPTLPWAGKEATWRAAFDLAKSFNEKRGGKTSQKISLPVIGHYEAKGRIGRDAFMYQDPKGTPGDFAECHTCHDYTGKSCENFPKGNTVSPHGSCGLYHYGPDNRPEPGKEIGAFTKAEAGYVEHAVRCENCAYFDDEEKYCELFEELNEHFPSVFDLKKEVHPKGCCNANISRGRHIEEKETQEAKTKTVAIDLDGTLAHYDGWRGEDVIGDPRPGAVEVVKWLKKRGNNIILWTTRGNTERLKKWLKEHDIPVDHINENPKQPPGSSKKIIAEIYVDDRVIDARKSWSEIKKELAERLEK